jgi:hypothetical protein
MRRYRCDQVKRRAVGRLFDGRLRGRQAGQSKAVLLRVEVLALMPFALVRTGTPKHRRIVRPAPQLAVSCARPQPTRRLTSGRRELARCTYAPTLQTNGQVARVAKTVVALSVARAEIGAGSKLLVDDLFERAPHLSP